MRKNFGVKTYLYPQPVLIVGTYDEDGNPNAMNAAWGGICDEDRIMISMSRHRTTDNIAKTGAFTVSVGTADQVTACDFVGIVSADRDPEKMRKSGFTAEKSPFVNAPLFRELPLTLECELSGILEGGYYIGKIVNVSADERILGDDGKPDVEKLAPITFDTVHNRYIALGETVGRAFRDGFALKD